MHARPCPAVGQHTLQYARSPFYCPKGAWGGGRGGGLRAPAQCHEGKTIAADQIAGIRFVIIFSASSYIVRELQAASPLYAAKTLFESQQRPTAGNDRKDFNQSTEDSWFCATENPLGLPGKCRGAVSA